MGGTETPCAHSVSTHGLQLNDGSAWDFSTLPWCKSDAHSGTPYFEFLISVLSWADVIWCYTVLGLWATAANAAPTQTPRHPIADTLHCAVFCVKPWCSWARCNKCLFYLQYFQLTTSLCSCNPTVNKEHLYKVRVGLAFTFEFFSSPSPLGRA